MHMTVTSRWQYDVRRRPAAAARVHVVDVCGRTVPGVVAAQRQAGGVCVRAHVGGDRPTTVAAADRHGTSLAEHVTFLPGARLVYVDRSSTTTPDDVKRRGEARRSTSFLLGMSSGAVAALAVAAIVLAASA